MFKKFKNNRNKAIEKIDVIKIRSISNYDDRVKALCSIWIGGMDVKYFKKN